MTARTILIERAARAICEANDDKWGCLPLGKAEWVHARGEFGGRYREVGEPYKADYLEMGEAALDALVPLGEAWIAPWEATDAMRTAWHDLGEFASVQKEWAAMRDSHLSSQPANEEGS